MEDIARSKDNRRAIHRRRIVFGNLILIIKLTVFIPVHRHAVWHQRIEGNNLALAVTDDLRVGIAPQKQMRHQGLAENETRHLRVWLVVQKEV